MDDPVLGQAWKLHRRGRFTEAVSLLEPQILSYRNHADFYRILGLSCLGTGDWKGGETYLLRSLQLDPEDRIQVLLALTAVAIRKKDTSEAVRLTLEVLDLQPNCRPARRALASLRMTLSQPEGRVSAPFAWQSLLPPTRRRKNFALPVRTGRLVVALILGISVATGLWWGWNRNAISPATGLREGSLEPLSATDLPQANTPVPTRIELSADQQKQTLTRIQDLFQAYRDSACRLEINRILLSNAPIATKERVRSLLTFLHAPDFARPEAGATYQEVRGFPELYEGCAVNWKGVVSRLVSGTDMITFDLLLGYQDGQVVEGVIPVALNFASLLKNSDAVEVLGQVELKDGGWAIAGRGLHVIGYRAP